MTQISFAEKRERQTDRHKEERKTDKNIKKEIKNLRPK